MARKKEIIWEGSWFDDTWNDVGNVDRTDIRQNTSRRTKADNAKPKRLAQHDSGRKDRVDGVD